MSTLMERIANIGRLLGMSPREAERTIGVHIRWMIRRDMEQILATELKAFDVPWTEEAFIQCLRQRNCIGMVAEINETVVGYMVYLLNKKSLEILNFGVDPLLSRNGIGTAMVDKLKGKLSVDRRDSLLLHIRETNLPAQLFFKSQGFMATGVFKNHWNESNEDAYRFEFFHTEEGN